MFFIYQENNILISNFARTESFLVGQRHEFLISDFDLILKKNITERVWLVEAKLSHFNSMESWSHLPLFGLTSYLNNCLTLKKKKYFYQFGLIRLIFFSAFCILAVILSIKKWRIVCPIFLKFKKKKHTKVLKCRD